MSDRYPLEVQEGTTFRAGFEIGETEDNVDEHYDEDDISSVDFVVRSGDYQFRDILPCHYEQGKWWATIAPDYPYQRHRSFYYGLDATFVSGDVVRLLQGPLRVRTIGGGS